MKLKIRKIMAAMLVMVLFLSACSAGGNSGADKSNGGGQGVPDYGDGLRYQPEWTKDAVIYEVNVRQYTPEGTFNAFAEYLQELKDKTVKI